MSLPEIWLSRSTSKTDALDDDETPLRFTATTRGVMVSGITGAKLHFVELGLKVNGEERIKVMDENIAPDSGALGSLGVSF